MLAVVLARHIVTTISLPDCKFIAVHDGRSSVLVNGSYVKSALLGLPVRDGIASVLGGHVDVMYSDVSPRRRLGPASSSTNMVIRQD